MSKLLCKKKEKQAEVLDIRKMKEKTRKTTHLMCQRRTQLVIRMSTRIRIKLNLLKTQKRLNQVMRNSHEQKNNKLQSNYANDTI